MSFFGAFSYNYFNKYPKKNIDAFQEGYQEIFQEVNLYLKGLDGRKKVSSVFITDKYGHSYIYALFFNQIKPIAYHQGALYQYQFFNKFGIGDLERKQALIITDFDNELPIERAEKVIYGVDGKIRFKIYLSNDLKNEK